MQKRLAMMTAIGCAVLLVVGCNRGSRGSPTAPTQGTPPQSAAVQAIQIGADSLSGVLAVGGKLQLRAIARMMDGSERDITSLATWSSDNPDVAAVSESGLVTANRRGAGRIRANYQDSSGDTSFNVVDTAGTNAGDPANPGSTQPPPSGSGPGPGGPAPGPGQGGTPTVSKLTITGDHTVPVGRSAQMRAIATMSDGSQRDVTANSDWRSDNSLIGAISQNGVLTGLTPGSNVVTAQHNGTSASQPVTVTPF
jgi:hypothetical protein